MWRVKSFVLCHEVELVKRKQSSAENISTPNAKQLHSVPARSQLRPAPLEMFSDTFDWSEQHRTYANHVKMICKSISRDLTCNVCTIREHSTFPLPCCCRSLAPKLKRSNYSSLPCMLHLEAALRATFLALVWWRFKQLVASIRLSMKIS